MTTGSSTDRASIHPPTGVDTVVLHRTLEAEDTGTEAWVEDVMRTACAKIAPLWPLERFVAVNPYLGLADRRVDEVAGLLESAVGAQTAMPVSYYFDALRDGRMTLDDVAVALARHGGAATADPTRFLEVTNSLGLTLEYEMT